jgi:hypothetical protein
MKKTPPPPLLSFSSSGRSARRYCFAQFCCMSRKESNGPGRPTGTTKSSKIAFDETPSAIEPMWDQHRCMGDVIQLEAAAGRRAHQSSAGTGTRGRRQASATANAGSPAGVTAPRTTKTGPATPNTPARPAAR